MRLTVPRPSRPPHGQAPQNTAVAHGPLPHSLSTWVTQIGQQGSDEDGHLAVSAGTGRPRERLQTTRGARSMPFGTPGFAIPSRCEWLQRTKGVFRRVSWSGTISCQKQTNGRELARRRSPGSSMTRVKRRSPSFPKGHRGTGRVHSHRQRRSRAQARPAA